MKKYFFIILLSDYANAQDPTFSDPINNRSYFHPTSLSVLRGIEGGGNYQTNMVGVLPIIRTGYCYFNCSYKFKDKVYLGQGFSYLNDAEGKNPQIKTSSFKANIINFRWFYKKWEVVNCDNFQNKPFVAMGLYLGWFTKSLNTGDLIFSKQIEAWSSTPVSNSDYSLYNRRTRADIGGNFQVKFPISKYAKTNYNWIGNISASVHHLQSPRNNMDADTEASFVKNGGGISLPRYSVYIFSVIHTNPNILSKEFYAQIETQRPIKRIVIGTNFFIKGGLISIGAAFSSYNIENYRKNVNTFISTINFVIINPSKNGSSAIFTKFFISYTSVLSGLGYAPIINKYGSIQVGFKMSVNSGCSYDKVVCPPTLF